MNKKKLLWRLTAITLSTFMAMQMIAPFTNILAIENEKIKNLVSYGEYYNQDIVSRNETSEIITVNEDENVIVKEPVVQETTSNYSENQEVVSKRTENSKTYQVGEDQYVTELYMTPVHKKEGKEFKEIDNTLETKNSLFRSTPVYENKDGLYDVSIANGVITITTESGKTITLTPSGNLGNYAIKDNVILYSSVEDNIDVEYRIESTIIRQNIYINGAIEKANYTFDAYAPELEMKEEKDGSLSFYDGKELVYQLVAPYLSDKDGKRNEECEYTYSKNEDTSYQVSLSFNKDWTNATDRVYPVKARAAVAVPTSSEILGIRTSYVRSATDDYISSQYSDLFVGYDMNFYGGPNSNIGIARTLVHFPMPNIGADQRVESANLLLYKEQSMAGEWNEISVYNANYADPYAVSWKTQPTTNKQLLSTQNVGNPIGYKGFDITKHVQELNEGQNKTLILQSTNETPAYFCNVFNSESTDNRPQIEIMHRDNYDVDPNLDINQFDNTMRVYAKYEESFEAISMDGIAKPDSKIKFDLYEKVNETDFEFVKTHTAKENSSRYFVDPIFVTNPLENVQSQEKRDVNYTTDYFRYGELPKYDTYYEYRMSVEHNGTTSEKVLYTDGFILYKVKLGDNLKTIASHYGLKIEDIKRDNNQVDDKVKEDDILFLRFAKDNPLVPADVYRPPLKLSKYEAEYVYRGPSCYGTCALGDPVNTSIGNFYHESDDVTLKDFDDFQLTRVYNSYGDDISNMFGNNFASNFEQYISYTKDDDILFFRGDGKILKIEKKDGKYVPNTSDKITFEEKEGKIEITDTRTDLTYIFDSYGVLTSIRTKNGFISDIIYNENNMITSVKMGEKEMTFSYNAYHLVDAITLPNGVKVQYKYNEQRQLTEFIDGNGNSEKYTYDENGKIAHIVDRNGNEIANNTYNKDGMVLSQTDGTGNTIDFDYGKNKTTLTYNGTDSEVYELNEELKVSKIAMSDGTATAYEYNKDGNLIKETNAAGQVTTYEYNKEHQLTKENKYDGTTVVYTYDGQGNVTSITDEQGLVETATYDENNNVISKTTTDGLTSTFTYNDKGLVASETDALGVTKSYEYTGNLVSKMTRSDGYAVEYTYDAIGNVTREADSNGRVVTYVYDNNNQVIKKTDALGQSEEYQYDGNGNIITYIDKAGAITTYTYDASNRQLKSTKGTQVVSKIYDNFGRVISETTNGLTIQYEYDVRGNKVKEIDAFGNATTFTYDEVNHLLTTKDAKGNVETKEYVNDNVVKEIDKFGNVTTYTYDNKNRVIETTTDAGTETKAYDAKGNVISTTSVKGNVSTNEYDAFNRLVKSVSETGVVTVYEYDVFNNLMKQTEDDKVTTFTYDVYNNKLTETDTNGNTTTYQYDALNRCVKEVDALGGTTTHVFNAMNNEIETIDALGNSEKTIYDQNQMVLQEIDKLGYGTTYTYDERGNVLTSTDANGVVTAYTYDEYNNVVTSKVNDTLMNTTSYDKYGRKVKEDSIVDVITYTYDQFDRVVEENNKTTGLIKTTRYDSHSNIIEESDNGGRTTTYEFDKFDQVVKTTDVYGRVETNVYDEFGRVTETNSYTNEITKSTYDKYGNVLVATDKYGNETVNTYDLLNRNTTITSQKGVVTTNTYDALGRVISTHDSFTDTTTYSEYDAVGNVIKTTDALGNVTQTQYDAKGQIIRTTDALGHASLSEYDIYGNEVKTTLMDFLKKKLMNVVLRLHIFTMINYK